MMYLTRHCPISVAVDDAHRRQALVLAGQRYEANRTDGLVDGAVKLSGTRPDEIGLFGEVAVSQFFDVPLLNPTADRKLGTKGPDVVINGWSTQIKTTPTSYGCLWVVSLDDLVGCDALLLVHAMPNESKAAIVGVISVWLFRSIQKPIVRTGWDGKVIASYKHAVEQDRLADPRLLLTVPRRKS